MAASFKVRRAGRVEGMNHFALTGEILEGQPRIGMWAELEDEGATLFRERVHGVQFLPGAGAPALTFEYRDQAQLDEWSAIGWADRSVTLQF
jgi:hypothetical protein